MVGVWHEGRSGAKGTISAHWACKWDSSTAVDEACRIALNDDSFVVQHGAATAKGVRSVMSSMVGMAIRHGAMTTNPTRDVAPISVRKKIVRALTVEETTLLVKKLRTDKEAKRLDLVDLVEFMLGTGARLGEACALRLPQVDLEGRTVEISATATAFGIEERPKTKAGWWVIAIPPNVKKILRRRVRASRLRTEVVLFPSPIGRVRDPSNTSADLRRALGMRALTGSRATHSARRLPPGWTRRAFPPAPSLTTLVTRRQA
jgi:integrase